jgi:hypothetical protein
VTSVDEMACAHHEAGHTVADVQFELGCDIITIIPNEQTGALGCASCFGDHYDFVPTDSGQELHVNAATAENVIVSLLAGYAADIRFGTSKILARQGAASDFGKARQTLKESGKKPDLRPWIKRADELVRNNWAAIQMIAHDLMETKTLDGMEVETIIDIAKGEPDAVERLARYRVLAGRGPTSQFPFVITCAGDSR